MQNQTQSRVNRWLKLTLAFLGLVIVSIGLGYLIEYSLAHYHIPAHVPIWLALLLITGILAAINTSLLPLPFGVSILLVAAAHWNPVLIALFGSLGASLGEFLSYFFGYLGKRISIDENTPGYKMVRGWVVKYGMWGIAFLSFQPVIPFEIGGFIAGVTRMPIRQFLPAIWIGKFPKYLLLIYLGDTLMRLVPFLHY